jgi:predicted ATPase/class 3 adenylate cyclase/tetratricopeptide (TPR) repeat protein
VGAQPTGTVTLLFTDIEGSTRLLERLGPERYRDSLELHRRLLRQAFARHGGYEVDHEGDAFFIAFGRADEAVAAAAESQRALAEAEWPEGVPIRVRMGIHTGEPLAAPPKYVGLDVHKAARIMAAGHGGQVLISAATQKRLDRDLVTASLGEHRLKDLAQPEPLYQLQIDGLPDEFPALKTLGNRPNNLPIVATPFIGRDDDLEQVGALLGRQDVRLLTLTGPGGIGKTRLALQSAADVLDAFTSGVFWVPLASLRDPALVVAAVAQALAVREEPGEPLSETLARYLADKHLLLLLDNFEHLIDAATAVSRVLAAAPKLRLLVTSREPLRLQGEHLYDVPPLALPEANDAATVEAVDAVQLFVKRAQAADPTFDVTDENAAVLADIVRRVEGIPLALELAAARVRELPPRALLRRLESRLGILTSGNRDADERQRTLRATIAWSYDLLTPEEQKLLARLAVFVGGCRLDAVEAVCDYDGAREISLLEGITSLLQKSLLRQRPDPDGEPRYWMLETIREFALEQGQGGATFPELAKRHALHYLAVVESPDDACPYENQVDRFDQFDVEIANLRAAIEWTRESGAEDVLLRYATALWEYWYARGHVAEGTAAFERALAATQQPSLHALIGYCKLRYLAGTSAAQILPDAEAALEASERVRDDLSCAQAWNLVGALRGGVLAQFASAELAFQQALGYARRANNPAETAESVWGLMLTAYCGPLPVASAIARADELLRIVVEEPAAQAFCLSARGALLAMAGDVDAGRRSLAEGTTLFERLKLNVSSANNAQLSFVIEMLAGDPSAAAEALRASFARLTQMGEKGFSATIAGYLAHALHAVGDVGEAERYSRVCEAAASTDDFISQILWRSARAKVLASRGRLVDAETLASEAVRLAEQTDLLNAQADALLNLAEVLARAERPREALALVEDAVRRYERKGNRVSLQRAVDRAEALRATGTAIEQAQPTR